jgi:hypothetical protein
MSKYFLKVECPHKHVEEIYINPEFIIKVFKIKNYHTSIQFVDDGSRDSDGESSGNYINDKRTVNEVIAEIEKVMEARSNLARGIGNGLHECVTDSITGEMKRLYHD